MIRRDKNPNNSLGITLGAFPILDVMRMTLMNTMNQYALTQLAQKNAKGFVTAKGISLIIEHTVFKNNIS